MINMQTKAEQIEELKEELKTIAAIHLKGTDRLQKQTEALEKPKQWEPRGGGYWVCGGGDVDDCKTVTRTSKFGVERQTTEAAEKASAAMRTHNRLLAYVDEFGGFWEADWADMTGQEKYCVYHHQTSCSWYVHTSRRGWSISGTVYMSQDCAEGLRDKLNSGEVTL